MLTPQRGQQMAVDTAAVLVRALSIGPLAPQRGTYTSMPYKGAQSARGVVGAGAGALEGLDSSPVCSTAQYCVLLSALRARDDYCFSSLSTCSAAHGANVIRKDRAFSSPAFAAATRAAHTSAAS